jgi:hypothetical protein
MAVSRRLHDGYAVATWRSRARGTARARGLVEVREAEAADDDGWRYMMMS